MDANIQDGSGKIYGMEQDSYDNDYGMNQIATEVATFQNQIATDRAELLFFFSLRARRHGLALRSA